MSNTVLNPKLYQHETLTDKEFTNIYAKIKNLTDQIEHFIPLTGDTIQNVGTGAGTVSRDKVGTIFYLKTIKVGTGITIANNPDDITISSSAGTVTNVSVVTANGLSGTVATPTTTPAISLSLGAITPSSVISVGVVSGSNFPSGVVVGTTDTQILTNKRVEKRTYTVTSTATLTPEIDTYDVFHLTAQAVALTIANHSTSTPVSSEMILIKILDNGTAQTITFGTNYVAKAGVALPTTTVASKNMAMLFMWDSNLSKYNLLALGNE